MTDDKQKPDGWVLQLDHCLIAIHDSSPDFAWLSAERICGMKQSTLEAMGWRIRPVKLIFLDEEK